MVCPSASNFSFCASIPFGYLAFNSNISYRRTLNYAENYSNNYLLLYIINSSGNAPPCAISNPSVSNAAAVTVSSKATCDHEYKLLGKTCKRLHGAAAAVCWAGAAAAYAACLAGKSSNATNSQTLSSNPKSEQPAIEDTRI